MIEQPLPTAATTVAELFDDACPIVAEMFDAVCYARREAHDGELEEDWRSGRPPEAEFDLQCGGPVLLKRGLGLRLELHIRRMRRLDQGPRMTDHQVIDFKDDLLSLLHELIHALGPGNATIAEEDWWTAHRYPHAKVAAEGTTELATQLFIDDFIRALGLDQIEPRLLDAPLRERPYPSETAAMRQLLSHVSARTRVVLPADRIAGDDLDPEEARLRAEVRDMVGAGTGDRPMMLMIHRFMGAESLDLLNRPGYPAAFAAISRRIDAALDTIGADPRLRSSPDVVATIMSRTLNEIEDTVTRYQNLIGPHPELRSGPDRSFRGRRQPVAPPEREVG